MNLKGFKKVSEDDEKAVLQNDQGHAFTIAKKALKREHLQRLKELPLHAASGDVIKDPTEDLFDDSNASSVEAGLPVRKEAGATAAYVPGMYQGVPGSPFDKAYETAKKAFEQPEKPGKDIWKEVSQEQDKLAAPTLAPQPQQPASVAPASVSTPEEVAQPQPELEQQAQPAQPSHQAPMAQPAQEPVKSVSQELDDEAIKWHQDLVNGHVSPETYQSLYDKKDTLGKVGTLFGLLLSGVGSGLSGQPNMVMEMMDREIQRDLDAQKQSKSNAVNYLRLNMEQNFNKAKMAQMVKEGKLTEAQAKAAYAEAEIKSYQAAYAQSVLGAVHYGQQVVDKLPLGEQKLRGQQMINDVRGAAAQKIAQGNAQAGERIQKLDPEAAFRQRQQTLMQGPAMGMPGMAEVARAEAERHVPGVGDASIPVPGNVREEMVSHDKLQNAAQDLLQYSQDHTNLVPGTPEYNVGVQKSRVLQQMVREGLLGTVFRESEKPLLNAFVNDNPAGALKSISTQPKLRTLLEANTMAANAQKSAYGLPTKEAAKKESGHKDKDGRPMHWKSGVGFVYTKGKK